MTKSAEIDLPVIHKYAGALFNLVEPAFSKSVTLKETDHFGFMALCFVHKQIEHARSLGILIDSKQYTDAIILARAMLEGLIFILWARLDKVDRALSWRSFALVSDYETLLAMKKRGEKVDKNFEKKLLDRLSAEAGRFRTKGAMKHGTENVENPYQKYWHVDGNGRRIELTEMAQEIGDPLVKNLYDNLSQLGHWTVRGIGPLIRRGNNGVKIDFDSHSNAAQACAVCIHSLGATAKAVAEHFEMNIELEIDKLFNAYLAELGVAEKHEN
jgi:Family of unknown function (DUF5677)